MIVGVVGYGCTGASACVDFLKELGYFQYLSNASEFQLIKMSDGLIDLHYHLVEDTRPLAQNTAIKRFLKIYKNPGLANINKITHRKFKVLIKEYIDDLCDIKWNGRSSLDPCDIRRKNDSIYFSKINSAINYFLRLFSYKFHFPRYSVRYYTQLTHSEFCEKTKNFLSRLLVELKFDKSKNILLEQIVDACNPTLGLDYFSDCKIIVIDRDPRDIYILKKYIYKNSPPFIPTNNSVDEFISFYKMQRKEKDLSKNILYLNFEDLIYKYDDTTRVICDFLGIKYNSNNKFKIFNPSDSIANTNLSTKLPQYKGEIEEICNKLAEYLYNFPKSTSIKCNLSKPFNENKKHD